MRNVRMLVGVAAVATAGCTVNPKATMLEASSHQTVLAHRANVVGTFYMQASRLDIAFKNAAEAGKPPKWGLTVASEPVEAVDRRFLLLQSSDLMSRTTLVVAKRPNTDLIASIGSEVTDNRIALIQNVAAIAKVAIGFAVSGAAPLNKPFSTRWSLTDPGDFVAATSSQEGWMAWKHSTMPTLTIRVGRAPTTATSYSAGLLKPRMNGVYHSACRPVIVAYKAPDGEEFEWIGKIADPNSVEFSALPRKGKVEFHSQCGVSITNEKDPSSTPDAIAAAAAAQAAAVIEAYKKAQE